ncbi:MAG: hydrogenase iron-sulfur subunit [Thermodesulfobacteriota bacterium]|nr:hydrogenase iron-sulfur subunit [Thermodesulfobacteriota bacterium]
MGEHKAFEPRIIAFLCNWCSYGAADLAGVSRMRYPANIRVIRIPCTGRMSPKFVLQALLQGADGVWVSGCHPGDCHYIDGNLYARRRFAVLKKFLEYVGFEPGRLQFSWISSAEGEKFRKTATEVVEAVRALGPARRMIKDIGKVG